MLRCRHAEREVRGSNLAGIPISTSRLRCTYLGAAAGTILIGLAVARGGLPLSLAVRDKLGDALWAVMMFSLVSAAAPRAGLLRRAGVAVGICFAVELSQLYHAPSVDALRRTMLGHLVLGSGFDAGDLVAYAVGVFVAASVERIGRRRARGDPS